MTQITLRGFDSELEKRLRDLARRNATSLNKAALQLMRRGAGLESGFSSTRPIGDALSRFAGRMSIGDVQAIDKAVAAARQTDIDLQP